MIGVKGRRYRLWLSGKGDGVGGVGANQGGDITVCDICSGISLC